MRAWTKWEDDYLLKFYGCGGCVGAWHMAGDLNRTEAAVYQRVSKLRRGRAFGNHAANVDAALPKRRIKLTNIVKLPNPNEGKAAAASDEPPVVLLPIDLPPPEMSNLGFDDMEAVFNMRDWLKKACEAQGAKMTGGGFGGGGGDLSIELEGCPYWVTIKPMSR